MIVSENILTWIMRLYPPMFFQRIWVKKFHKGFLGVDVKINKSIWNNNLNNSIFGGTIYCATDPFYALCFGQVMQRKGFKVLVWLKSASIQYIKPGNTSLYFTIYITDDMIADAEIALRETGKFIKSYPMELFNKRGELCATVTNEIYVRNKLFEHKTDAPA